ncbi:hypothetical protein CLU79DRAFT_694474, partial [Phycomyces nitens]
LLPNGNNDMLFGNLLRSDGFSLDFLFYKRRQTGYGPSYQSLELKLGDFTMSEIDEMYTPICIDPGRKSVFTATIGSDLQTRRCTRSEYHHMTGVTNFALRLEKKKIESGIGLIESNLPTPKTSNIAKFEEYIKSILTNAASVLVIWISLKPLNSKVTAFYIVRSVASYGNAMSMLL